MLLMILKQIIIKLLRMKMRLSFHEGMGAVNQLQGQGLGMAKGLSSTKDDLVEKVRYVL